MGDRERTENQVLLENRSVSMLAKRWPEARWLGNATTYGRRLTSYHGRTLEPVMLWHTTETRGLPSYRGGAVAPTFSADPRRGIFYQHAEIGEVVGTLKGWEASGGPTNHANLVTQVEIICYSAGWIAKTVGGLWVGALTEEQLAWLAKIPRFLMDEGWISGEAAYSPGWTGTSNINEMTWNEWLYGRDAWNMTGHDQNPDASKHWDPGALDRLAIVEYANGTPPVAAPDEEENMKRGDEGRRVRWLQIRLNKYGASPALVVDGIFGPKTEAALVAYQESKTYLDADGIAMALDVEFLRRRPS
jgi:hypothetical protein